MPESSINENWGKNDFGDFVLHLEIHSLGWSDNECYIESLLSNNNAIMFYQKWIKGGHHYFEIRPESVGYLLVSEYCKKHGISKQAIHQSKDKYDWIRASKNKQYIRLKS